MNIGKYIENAAAKKTFITFLGLDIILLEKGTEFIIHKKNESSSS